MHKGRRRPLMRICGSEANKRPLLGPTARREASPPRADGSQGSKACALSCVERLSLSRLALLLARRRGNLTLTRNCTPSGVITGIAPAWSLAVEVVFYLMLPALVLIGSHRHTRGKADHHEITFGAGAATLSFSFLDSLARPRPPSSVQARTTAGERTGARSWSGASFAMGISSPLGWPSPYSTPRSKTAYYE